MQHFISYIKLPKTLTVTTLLFGPVTLLRCFVGWSVDISLLWVMSEESVPLWTPSNRHTSVLPTPSRLNARQRIGTWSLHWKGSVSGARENLFFMSLQRDTSFTYRAHWLEWEQIISLYPSPQESQNATQLTLWVSACHLHSHDTKVQWQEMGKIWQCLFKFVNLFAFSVFFLASSFSSSSICFSVF